MRILTQNLLTIVPLFAGLAAMTGVVTYTSAQREMMWGLREEAASLAVATAEFLDADSVAAAGANPASSAYLRGIAPRLDRLQEFGQARRVVALSPDARRVLVSGGEAPARGSGLAPEERSGALAAMARDTAWISGLRRPGPEEAYLLAFAPITGADGSLVGMVEVETDAASFMAGSRRVLRQMIVAGLLISLLGLGAALFLAHLVTRRVRDLSRAATLVARGQHDREIHIDTIREVSDLANTFNTMSSVLRDLLRKARRSLVEAEQFRTEDDLAASLRETLLPPVSEELGGVAVRGRAIGAAEPGDFVGAARAGERFHAFLGRAAEGSRLDSAASAAAARDFLAERLAREPAGEALREAVELFGLETLRWAGWGEGSAVDLASWSAAPGAGWTRGTLELDAEEARVLHNLGEPAEATLRRLSPLARHFPPDELLAALEHAVGTGASGSLLVLRRA